MERHSIKSLHVGVGQMTDVYCADRIPANRRKMTDAGGFGWLVLPVAARQAKGSHLSDVRLSRYFIFTDRNRTGYDWTGAPVTRVGGEVKILFSHDVLSKVKSPPPTLIALGSRCLCTIALIQK